MSITVDKLSVTLNFHDEWPARVGELICDIAEWYAAHPSLVDLPAHDIASFLLDVAESESVDHVMSTSPIHLDSAGRAKYTVDSTIDFDHFRRTLAVAAFERYGHLHAA